MPTDLTRGAQRDGAGGVPRREAAWKLPPLAAAVGLFAAGCALVLGSGTAPPISADGYRESDAVMARSGFRVMPGRSGTAEPATFGRIQRVYVKGSGPRVVVLHELPGLRKGDIDVAAALSERFEVYVPLMFGVAGQDDAGLGKKQACKTGLFKCNDRDTRHPITTDLLEMANQVCGSIECGVVGMCLTGTFPLYLMPSKGVVALVLAQPTLPLIWHIWPFAGLDISEQDTTAAMKQAAERAASIYLVRYRRDLISGRSAFKRLVKRIEPWKDKLTFFAATEVDARGHSTLVHDSDHPEVAKEQLQAVVKALNARLRRDASTSPARR